MRSHIPRLILAQHAIFDRMAKLYSRHLDMGGIRMGLLKRYCLYAATAAMFILPFPWPAASVSAVSRPAESRIKLPIVMYHGIIDDPRRQGTYVIGRNELESDLKYIRDNGYTTVVVQDLLDYIYDGVPLPEKPIMLTFDDGYYNNYLYAYPLLKEYGMKAVVSLIGRYTDKYTLTIYNNPLYSHITWSQAREMSDSGVIELQNHSYDLHTITRDRTASTRAKGETLAHYEKALISDTIRLQALMDSNIKRMPTAYVYPFGLICKDEQEILKEIGFRSTMTCFSGINTVTKDPECLYMMKRLLRPHGKGVAALLGG
jgi:peptidoglycan/xylan/chitin deacetylase (PgdA/CDA1 family)